MVRQIGWWDGCSLEGDAHTSFQLLRCERCGKICGFPEWNFDLDLTTGTVATKEKMAQLMSVPNPML